MPKPRQKLKLYKSESAHSHFQLSMRDGTSLYVHTIFQPGAKGMPLVLNDGLGCDGYTWKYIIDHFQHNHPIIHWNYRGHGQSRVPSDLSSITMKNLAADLGQVLEHLGIESAILCGHSMGVQVCLESYATFPERVAGLLLLCGGYKYPLETWHAALERKGAPTLLNLGMKRYFPRVAKSILERPELWQRVWQRLLPTDLSYRTAIQFEVNKSRILRDDFFPYFEHLGKMQARVFAQTASSFAEHNAEPILSQIDKPTLVVAGGRDTFSPPWVSLDMHRSIAGSELLYISDGTHAAPIEHPELLNLRLEKFIQRHLAKHTKRNAPQLRQIQVAS